MIYRQNGKQLNSQEIHDSEILLKKCKDGKLFTDKVLIISSLLNLLLDRLLAVVYTPMYAVHVEYVYFCKRNMPLLHRSHLLVQQTF